MLFINVLRSIDVSYETLPDLNLLMNARFLKMSKSHVFQKHYCHINIDIY